MKFDPANDIYCCEMMYKESLYGSSLIIITPLDLRHPVTKKINQNFPQVKTELNQVWIINDEFGELEGEPFKICPWCKTELT